MSNAKTDGTVLEKEPDLHRPAKIISGGQSGADHGGLLAGQMLKIPTGGWATKGFRTEYGPRPLMGSVFGLQESKSPAYPVRTRLNVRDSDGTVWFGVTDSPGYYCTVRAALDLQKPFIINPSPEELRGFVREHSVKVLNVAGNRASKNPGITERVVEVLLEAFE